MIILAIFDLMHLARVNLFVFVSFDDTLVKVLLKLKRVVHIPAKHATLS